MTPRAARRSCPRAAACSSSSSPPARSDAISPPFHDLLRATFHRPSACCSSSSPRLQLLLAAVHVAKGSFTTFALVIPLLYCTRRMHAHVNAKWAPQLETLPLAERAKEGGGLVTSTLPPAAVGDLQVRSLPALPMTFRRLLSDPPPPLSPVPRPPPTAPRRRAAAAPLVV